MVFSFREYVFSTNAPFPINLNSPSFPHNLSFPILVYFAVTLFTNPLRDFLRASQVSRWYSTEDLSVMLPIIDLSLAGGCKLPQHGLLRIVPWRKRKEEREEGKRELGLKKGSCAFPCCASLAVCLLSLTQRLCPTSQRPKSLDFRTDLLWQRKLSLGKQPRVTFTLMSAFLFIRLPLAMGL